jgi:hypothetical protein
LSSYFIYPSLDVSDQGHHAVVKKLLTLINMSQFPSITLTHFIIVKLAVTAHAQVSGHAVVTFNSTAFAVLVLAHPAVVRSHDCTILAVATHTAPVFSRLSYLLATNYHSLPQ